MIKRVGESLITRFEELEAELFEAQLQYNAAAAANVGPMQTLVASYADEENAGVYDLRRRNGFLLVALTLRF